MRRAYCFISEIQEYSIQPKKSRLNTASIISIACFRSCLVRGRGYSWNSAPGLLIHPHFLQGRNWIPSSSSVSKNLKLNTFDTDTHHCVSFSIDDLFEDDRGIISARDAKYAETFAWEVVEYILRANVQEFASKYRAYTIHCLRCLMPVFETDWVISANGRDDLRRAGLHASPSSTLCPSGHLVL